MKARNKARLFILGISIIAQFSSTNRTTDRDLGSRDQKWKSQNILFAENMIVYKELPQNITRDSYN